MRRATLSRISTSPGSPRPSSIFRSSRVMPRSALAARRALAARLLGVEARHAPEAAHHAGGVVHDDDAARAGHRSACALSASNSSATSSSSAASTGADEPPGMTAFTLRPAGMPCPQLRVVDELAHAWCCIGDLEDARPVHRAREAHQPRAARLVGAELGEPLGAAARRWPAPRRASRRCSPPSGSRRGRPPRGTAA